MEDALALCTICDEYIFDVEVERGEARVDSGSSLPAHHAGCLAKFLKTGELHPAAAKYYGDPETYWTELYGHNDAVSYAEIACQLHVKRISLDDAKAFLYRCAKDLKLDEAVVEWQSLILSGAVLVPVFVCRTAHRPDIYFPNETEDGLLQSKREIDIIRRARTADTPLDFVVLVPSRDPDKEDPTKDGLRPYGTLALIKAVEYPDGGEFVTLTTLKRVQVHWPESVRSSGVFVTELHEIPDLNFEDETVVAKVEHLAMVIKDVGGQVFSEITILLWRKRTQEIREGRFGILLDMFANYAGKDSLSPWERELFPYRIAVLEAGSLARRLDVALSLSEMLYHSVKKAREIISKDQEETAEQTRKRALREQIVSLEHEIEGLRKHLGETDEDDITTYRKRLAELPLPPDVREEVNVQLRRLGSSPSPLASQEHAHIYPYLDFVRALPWNRERYDETISINRARAILDRDHYGLEDIKKRILETLAVRSLRVQRGKDVTKDNIIGFVGPKGVGKTSLGKSIAEALGRKFHRMSLSDVKDEGDFRGHRLTYVSAGPGRFLQALRREKTQHLVMLLDEVDKIGRVHPTAPGVDAIFLEVLDPEQNNAFWDNYLGATFDLSPILFIVTANVTETIMPALQDRIEFIEIRGYTDEEKFQIAKRHLIPRQLREHALDVDEDECQLTNEAVHGIVTDYREDAQEVGMRGIERRIGQIYRKIARAIVEGKKRDVFMVSRSMLKEYLGEPKSRKKLGFHTENR